MRPDHPRIASVARALAALPAFAAPGGAAGLSQAAVALLLRPAGADVELLLIRRAERQGDPWSGHMALPGGRAQPGDAGPAATAARETREEVGIDPAGGGTLLGGLEPLWPHSGRAPRLLVHPFVFAVPGDAEPTPNHEVDAALWIPVSELLHPGAVTEHLYEIEGADPLRFPAIGTRGYVIWGLTHRILSDFLALYAASEAGDASEIGDAVQEG